MRHLSKIYQKSRLIIQLENKGTTNSQSHVCGTTMCAHMFYEGKNRTKEEKNLDHDLINIRKSERCN